MAVLDGSERGRSGGRDPAAAGKISRQAEHRSSSNAVREQRSARQRHQEVGVEVVIGGMTARDHRLYARMYFEVVQDAMRQVHAALAVIKAVARLRKEDGQAHHDREEDGRETGGPLAPHQARIVGERVRRKRRVVKLLADASTRKILGAHILAAEAGEMITEAATAIRFGLTVEDIGSTFHPYLTLSEGIKLAALAFTKDVEKLSCCAA